MVQTALQKLNAIVIRVLGAVGLAMLLVSVAQACPTCSEGLAQSDPHHQSIAAGFYYSILFMMSMPYIVFTSVACMFYLSVKRARERQALEGDQPLV
jgi:uncharacterized membrane protein